MVRARDAERFLDDIERRLAPLDRAILLAEWRLASGRSRVGAAAWQAQRHRLLSAPGVLESARRFRSARFGGALERRLSLLERATLESRIEQDPEIVLRRSRLQSRVARFRPRWHGRRVGRIVVRTAFRTSPDREERRKAYYAEDPLYRAIENDLRVLLSLRNQKAREFGFRSYPEFRLSFDRLSVARLETLLDESLRLVPAEMRRRRGAFEDRTGERGWYPWDTGYAWQIAGGLPEAAFPAHGMLASVLRGVGAWGVPPSALRFRIDRHDIPSGGLCIAPDPPRDVRIIVHPGRGWLEYMVLFHEVGHGVHSASIRAPSHLLRWSEGLPGFGGFHEGIGQFFELIAESEAWLRARGNLSAEKIDRFGAEIRRLPLWTIGSLVDWIRQELDLYLRPKEDPADRARRFGRTVLGFDAYEPRSFADSFFVDSPVYATSYLVATLLRPQLLDAALQEVGGSTWPNRKMGPWLIDRWFRDGSAFDWLPRVREVTGRPFGARAFNEAMR
jgi:hypothetical protein